jgi:hypothetical protein
MSSSVIWVPECALRLSHCIAYFETLQHSPSKECETSAWPAPNVVAHTDYKCNGRLHAALFATSALMSLCEISDVAIGAIKQVGGSTRRI